MLKEYKVTYLYLKETFHTPQGFIRGRRPVEDHEMSFVPALGVFKMVRKGSDTPFFVDRSAVEAFQMELPREEPVTAAKKTYKSKD